MSPADIFHSAEILVSPLPCALAARCVRWERRRCSFIRPFIRAQPAVIYCAGAERIATAVPPSIIWTFSRVHYLALGAHAVKLHYGTVGWMLWPRAAQKPLSVCACVNLPKQTLISFIAIYECQMMIRRTRALIICSAPFCARRFDFATSWLPS